jgi:hypothetical protein
MSKHSTRPASKPASRQALPRIPLTAHHAGYWCKKIGANCTTGPGTTDGSPGEVPGREDDLHAGRKSPRSGPH